MFGIFDAIDSFIWAPDGIVGLEIWGILGVGNLDLIVSFIANKCRLTLSFSPGPAGFSSTFAFTLAFLSFLGEIDSSSSSMSSSSECLPLLVGVDFSSSSFLSSSSINFEVSFGYSSDSTSSFFLSEPTLALIAMRPWTPIWWRPSSASHWVACLI